MRCMACSLALLLSLGCDSGSDADGGATPDASASVDAAQPGTDAGPIETDAGPPGAVVEPDDPGAADVRLSIDTTAETHPISPHIYGHNGPRWEDDTGVVTLERSGGNRWTAYNWENNASNAGSDWMHQNDSFLGGGDTPGGAVSERVNPAHAAGAAALITIPIAGFVAADTNGDGDVSATPDYLNRRFQRSETSGSTGVTPDLTDDVVHQEQFVRWAEQTLAPGGALFYSLDNEPDLWDDTHARIRSSQLTYEELVTRNIDYARAIRAEAPDAMIFGPAHYGFGGMINLQSAPDAGGRDFVEHYLEQLRAASEAEGGRLVDVLDIHWYPEARGDGQRVTDDGTSAGLAAARMQSTRSLWDPTYREESWIADFVGGPIALLPGLQEKIDRLWPGTRLAITEYYFGGGDHISGALAQAAALGVFGRADLFAACLWHIGSTEDTFINAAFRMYRDTGDGTRFGDTSAQALSDDDEGAAVFASTNAAGEVIVVAINRTADALDAGISLRHRGALSVGAAWQLTDAAAEPRAGSAPERVGQNAFRYGMPAMSVSTLRFGP